ncbi:sulfatase family protein [Hyaloraphidium curvatum]|nr:sulfatase family protein [Hyaloraphidium curvatum]
MEQPAAKPNILLILTDQERYPPPYEDAALAEFRATQLPARTRLLAGAQLHRHYVASTACAPSRASLFTGQYPSLHGVTATDGLSKTPHDERITWLDPDTVPTMGHLFRAAGYRTFYNGKWHISHADLVAPGTHVGLASNDAEGRILADVAAIYEKANRLSPFGFDGWIGREPHGSDGADCGTVKDPLYADQVGALLARLEEGGGPWLAVASFVNPHDICFPAPVFKLLGLPEPDDTVPAIPAPPSQADGFQGRPRAQKEWKDLWPEMLIPIESDELYRRRYMMLHKLVDAEIAKVLDALDARGLAGNTIVVFTSDHGEMLGAHGGMMQKWYTAFDEALRVPMAFSGPGIGTGDLRAPTSHADLIPTLLGLAGIDPADAIAAVKRTHTEVHPLPGRNLSPWIRNPSAAPPADPVYFYTEDQISVGDQPNMITGIHYPPILGDANVECIVAPFRGGLWKLVRYYPDGVPEEGIKGTLELYNLERDPEERHNLAKDRESQGLVAELLGLLHQERAKKRIKPAYQNAYAESEALRKARATAKPLLILRHYLLQTKNAALRYGPIVAAVIAAAAYYRMRAQ